MYTRKSPVRRALRALPSFSTRAPTSPKVTLFIHRATKSKFAAIPSKSGRNLCNAPLPFQTTHTDTRTYRERERERGISLIRVSRAKMINFLLTEFLCLGVGSHANATNNYQLIDIFTRTNTESARNSLLSVGEIERERARELFDPVEISLLTVNVTN